ncbi:hypothetical protein WBG99_27345 [Streptomyces sp. TG1A-60]|uniref:hypothetical protein n=1 Tax=Streptomyces sp. TG1A-60 TaxID=3129111 RepID=UPI0030D24EF1
MEAVAAVVVVADPGGLFRVGDGGGDVDDGVGRFLAGGDGAFDGVGGDLLAGRDGGGLGAGEEEGGVGGAAFGAAGEVVPPMWRGVWP